MGAPGDSRRPPVKATPAGETAAVPLEDLPTGIVTPTPAPPPITPTFTGAPVPTLTGNNVRVVREVGGFELIARIGEGGMGQVFKARQKSLDRLIALKILTPKLAGNLEYVKRFELEAKAAAKLDHENIVRVIEQGEDAGIRFIAFEFVDGTSLEGLLKKRGKLPENEALAIVRQVAEALRYAQSKSLIHRDVKPDNILLTREGIPKLADLGLAKFEGESSRLTQTGIVMGTPHYMAPEQALGEKDLDIRADLYALGLVLYRCLTGDLPWTQETALAILTRHINEDCPDPRIVVPAISESAVTILRGLTARDRDQRYLTPADSLRDIDLALSGGTPTGPSLDALQATVLEPPRTGAGLVPGARKASSGTIPVRGSSGKLGVANTLAGSRAVETPLTAAAPVAPPQRGVAVPAVAGLMVLGILLGVVAGRKKQTPPVVAGSPLPSPSSGATPPSDPANGGKGVKGVRPKTIDGMLDVCGRVLHEGGQEAEHELTTMLDYVKDDHPDEASGLERALQMVHAIEKVQSGFNKPGALVNLAKVNEGLDDLDKIVARPTTNALEASANVEARGWASAYRYLVATLHFVGGDVSGRALLATPPDLGPAVSPAKALGSAWLEVVHADVVPAIEAFDRQSYTDAVTHASDAAKKAPSTVLSSIATSMAAIAELSKTLLASKHLDAHALLEAFERVASVRPQDRGAQYALCDFVKARYRVVEFVGGTGPNKPALVTTQFAPSIPEPWTVDKEGLHPPDGDVLLLLNRSFRGKTRNRVPVDFSLSPDSVAAIRFRYTCVERSSNLLWVESQRNEDTVTPSEHLVVAFTGHQAPLLFDTALSPANLDEIGNRSRATHTHPDGQEHVEDVVFTSSKDGGVRVDATDDGAASTISFREPFPKDAHFFIRASNRTLKRVGVLLKR